MMMYVNDYWSKGSVSFFLFFIFYRFGYICFKIIWKNNNYDSFITSIIIKIIIIIIFIIIIIIMMELSRVIKVLS